MAEIKTAPGCDKLVVVQSSEPMGTISFDPDINSWVADADGQSRACATLDRAVNFVEAVWEPETEVRVLRS